MTVFIRYHHTNRDPAFAINGRLKRPRIETYINALDSASQRTDRTITSRINGCTHLLVVPSDDTEKSWWAPFETGEATIISRHIVSFHTEAAALPEYLGKVANSQKTTLTLAF